MTCWNIHENGIGIREMNYRVREQFSLMIIDILSRDFRIHKHRKERGILILHKVIRSDPLHKYTHIRTPNNYNSLVKTIRQMENRAISKWNQLSR